MLRQSRHVSGRKQKISNELPLFVHQQLLYIVALLSVSLEIGCKPPILLKFVSLLSYFTPTKALRWLKKVHRKIAVCYYCAVI